MTFKTGSSTDHTAFTNMLVTFVTTELPTLERHTILRNVTNSVTSGVSREIIFRAPGLSGVNYLYWGLRLNIQPSLDVFNLELGIFNGYVSSNTWENQPGLGAVGLPLWNQSIPYWITGTKKGINICVRIQNHYFTITGQLPTLWNIPFAGQYFPFVGGCLPGGIINTRYSVTTIYNWFNTKVGGVPFIKNLLGNWTTVSLSPYSVPAIIPNYRNLPAGLDSNISDGIYTLKPIIIVSHTEHNVYGQVEGLYFISGFNNSAENIITGTDGKDYIIFPDNLRTGFNEYIALRME